MLLGNLVIFCGSMIIMVNRNLLLVTVLVSLFLMSCSTASPIDPTIGIYRIEIEKVGPCEDFHFSSSINALGGYVYTEYDRSGKNPYILNEDENKSECNSLFTSINASDMIYSCSALNIHDGERDSLVVSAVAYFNEKEIGQKRHVFYSYTPDEIHSMEQPHKEVDTIFEFSLKSFLE